MEKPIVVERFANNGAFSHYALIGSEGDLLWSEAPEEELQKVVKENELLHDVSVSDLEFNAALTLLRDLADLQNGAPLVRHEKEWDEVMTNTYDFLEQHSR